MTALRHGDQVFDLTNPVLFHCGWSWQTVSYRWQEPSLVKALDTTDATNVHFEGRGVLLAWTISHSPIERLHCLSLILITCKLGLNLIIFHLVWATLLPYWRRPSVAMDYWWSFFNLWFYLGRATASSQGFFKLFWTRFLVELHKFKLNPATVLLEWADKVWKFPASILTALFDILWPEIRF